MYAHITTLQVRPNAVEETVSIYTQRILPCIQQQPGCCFVTLLTNSSNCEIIAICWWASEADLLVGQCDSDYKQQLAQIGPLLLTTPVSHAYRVNWQVAPL
jgi:hypothetical protein